MLGGILSGIMTALLYQRFYRVKLPAYLAFFGGRRFVPIITALAALVLGVVFGIIWPPSGALINSLGNWITRARRARCRASTASSTGCCCRSVCTTS